MQNSIQRDPRYRVNEDQYHGEVLRGRINNDMTGTNQANQPYNV